MSILNQIAVILVLTTAVGSATCRPPETPRPMFGRASWYGKVFQGKRTASGERFNTRDLTAAHRTLPLGSRVLVTNLKNGRSVVVRINDRGPVIRSRMLDMSYGTALALDVGKDGVVEVRVDVISSS